MSDYGTFESLGHEGYDKKIAAEKRDEALDRAAARIIEDTGDFFRNAASQDDFNQRWDMGITNVRRSAAKETETSDDTMNAIRERVAALTIDTKPKPRKRAARRKASAPAKRRTATHVTWENDGFGTDMFGNEYTISLGGAGEYDLTVNDGLTTTTVGRYPTREQAQDAARAVYARRSALRKQAAQWENDGESAVRIEFPPGYWYRVQETFQGDFEVSHNGDDGTPWTFGPYDTLEEAKAEAIADAKARGVYREASRTARRKRAFNSYTDWADFSAVDEAGYAVDTSDGGTYYVVTTDGASWSVYFESLEGDMVTVRTDIPDPDVAKAVAGDHNVNRNPNAYDRTSTRRKRASITWVPADNMGGEALTGTSDDGTSFDLYYGDDDLYHVVAYYPNGEVGADQTYETLADAKNHTEWAMRSAHRQASRRKQAWRITKNRDWSGSQLRQVSDTMYSIYPPSGADNIDGRFAVQKAIDRSRMVRRMELRYAPPWTSTNMPDDVVVGYYDTPEEAFQAVLSGEAFNKLDQIKNSNFKGAGRKQAWAMSDDGMTYTSTQVQDSFDCPTCGAGNKLGFSRCACGKQWNSYTIEGANGERRMVAREVEARPEAVLANRRRQARRKRAASEWFQRGNSERIELPGGVWCEVSEMSGKPGGPYGFIYGDGESDSGHVYDIGFPTMEQAKAAALDEVGFGGITANRRRQAARRRAQAGRESSNPAYNAGRRAAQRNLPVNPAAPLAYLTGYRDYLRSAIKRG